MTAHFPLLSTLRVKTIHPIYRGQITVAQGCQWKSCPWNAGDGVAQRENPLSPPGAVAKDILYSAQKGYVVSVEGERHRVAFGYNTMADRPQRESESLERLIK